MTHFFKNISIKSKLTLVIMLVSSILLLIISSIVLVTEIYVAKKGLTQDLRILASAISANSRKPLMLGQYDKVDALLASLIHQENIHAAYLFDSQGVPVAEYLQQQGGHFVLQGLKNDFSEEHIPLWTDSITEQQLSSIRHFSLFVPVFHEGGRVGTLYLLSDLNRLYAHLSGVGFGIILSLLLMIVLSWFLAGRLQKPVLDPLLQLTRLMETIAQTKDYSIRAHKVSGDEVGVLVDGFNQVLDQVESHQASLAEHHIFLEQTVSDRTAELRVAVEGLEQARKQADTANEAKSHFLSRMTHELRTPLIGVLGMNELMLRTPLSEQQKMLVDTVQKSGEQLLRLVTDVLDFSRIEAGKLLLELNQFELSEAVEAVVKLLTPLAQEKGLSLLTNISSSAIGKIRADEVKIRQVLMNLVGNAIKFTSRGSITVSLNCTQQSDSSGTFVLEVADTGIGITTEGKQQIFDAFYQIDGIDSGTKRGAGLGLAIVKQLVDLMDGNLSLTSIPGEGSKFQVTVELQFVEKAVLQKGGSR